MTRFRVLARGCAALVASSVAVALGAGPAAAGPPPPPRGSGSGPPPVNRRIVTEAARHLGQNYVFGATGPRAFDCSGLVYFVYRKQGLRIPRQAQAQFLAAHRLPRAHARRGDLVFYHEPNGYTFHVAIYTGRGNTIVAANSRQGVIREHIWSRAVTFGSFTHRR